MKVLIAEDNPVARVTLRSHLRKWGYEVVETVDGPSAWDRLSQPDSPRLVILDWMMPEPDGLELCRRVRKQAQEPYIYIILLTGREEQEDIITGLDAGANDYVTKPFNVAELRVRVRAGERICRLQEELVSARESLRHQATHDILTSAWNRAAILDRLSREFARAERGSHPLSVAMIDFDHFKAINDRFGHPGGDAVLRGGAARIQGEIRAADALGRYGGEELLLVFPETGPDEALRAAERVRSAIAGSPFGTAERPIPATVSVGVAAWDGSEDCAALLGRADEALYEAKALGRDRVALRPPARASTAAG